MILVAILAVIFAVVLHFTPFGRGIYAIGLDEAAQFSGVRVKRTKLILFIVIGIISALAGIYYTRFVTAVPAETTRQAWSLGHRCGAPGRSVDLRRPWRDTRRDRGVLSSACWPARCAWPTSLQT